MDPFTQRMLERARARQEKINQKLVDSGQSVSKRKPLTENIIKGSSPVKSPAKTTRNSITSPRRSTNEPVKTNTPVKMPNKSSNDAKSNSMAKTPNKRSSMQGKQQKSDQLAVTSPQRARNDVVVTKKEFKSPKHGSLNRRNSDVSVEINISHRNDIQIEVQVEERDAPISVVYDSQGSSGSNVIIKEIEDTKLNQEDSESKTKIMELTDHKEEWGLRHNFKSRLDRLGNLYSDNPNLSSPIHRTEQEFSVATPPSAHQQVNQQEPEPQSNQGKKKFGRLAALADQINNWEDDLSHHNFHPEPTAKKTGPTKKPELKSDKLESSTLDVSIHSLNDINKVLSTTKSKQTANPINSHTFTKPTSNECHRLNKQIVAELVSSMSEESSTRSELPREGNRTCSKPRSKNST